MQGPVETQGVPLEASWLASSSRQKKATREEVADEEEIEHKEEGSLGEESLEEKRSDASADGKTLRNGFKNAGTTRDLGMGRRFLSRKASAGQEGVFKPLLRKFSMVPFHRSSQRSLDADDDSVENMGDASLEDDEEDDVWEMHPIQDNSGSMLEAVMHLTQMCGRQYHRISFRKKKRIPAIRQIETILLQLSCKLQAEEHLLSDHRELPEIKQSLLSLQDSLTLLSRKLVSISKRSYFLGRAYSKTMLMIHQSLNAAVTELFMCLSRAMIRETTTEMKRRNSESSGASSTLSYGALNPAGGIQEQVPDGGPTRSSTTAVDVKRWTGARRSSECTSTGTASSANLICCGDDAFDSSLLDEMLEPRFGDPTTEEMANAGGLSAQQASEPLEGDAGFSSALSSQGRHSFLRTDPTALDEASFEEDARSEASRPSFASLKEAVIQHQDDNLAEELFKRGELLESKASKNRDIRSAIIAFARSAQLGYVPAMIALARIYESGASADGVDLELAEHFLTCASDTDDAEGMTELALFKWRRAVAPMVDGTEFADNQADQGSFTGIEDALDLLKRASAAGSHEAQCVLGEYYLKQGNRGKARALFSAAASQDHTRAQNNLGVMLVDHPSTRREGAKLLEISASKGLPRAQNNLGMYKEKYLHDDQGALELYEKAARAGIPRALHNLGCAQLQASARSSNSHRSYELICQAQENLTCACAKGVVESHHFLGALAELQGDETPDAPVAAHHYKTCIRMLPAEHPVRPKSMLRLAAIHYNRKSYGKALDLYKALALEGNGEALNSLGLMCESGKTALGVPDFERAAGFFSLASKAGCTDAFVNLALLHVQGRGVPRSASKATELLQKALERNRFHGLATDLLGRI